MLSDDVLSSATAGRWSAERAWAWQRTRPWRVGCNYLPSSAANQLEMWQPATFAPDLIDRELGMLADTGFNAVRVFLHDLLWSDRPADFLARLERFLDLADRRGIATLFVFFDSCWHPFPRAGRQPEPEPGVHNSCWVQSPGLTVLRSPADFARLEPYVTGVIQRFRDDPRVEGWDLWNEPENPNPVSYLCRDLGAEKAEVVRPRLAQVFQWARRAAPTQPLTSGVYAGDWGDPAKLLPLHRLQFEASDVISFHRYQNAAETLAGVRELRSYGRPVWCTEYMARPRGSTFATMLPLFKAEGVSSYCWGSVAGRSQTCYAWDTWQQPCAGEPPVWFHDVFRPDGTPYDPRETALIRSLTQP